MKGKSEEKKFSRTFFCLLYQTLLDIKDQTMKKDRYENAYRSSFTH